MAKYDDVFIKRIQDIYENTEISLNKLAKKEKIGKATIIKWSQNFNWIKKNKSDRPPTDQNEKRPTEPTENKAVETPEQKEFISDIVDEVIEEEKVKKTYRIFTEKERMFLTYYFSYKFNVKAASLAVGYWSELEGYRMLNKPKIKKVVRRIKQIIFEKAEISFTPSDLIEELFIVLKKATGEIAQNKTFLVNKFEKEIVPVPLRLEEMNKEGVVSYKEVAKNHTTENSWQEPEEHCVKETDLKAANTAIKLLVDLYGYMDSSKLARERFDHDKEKYNNEKTKEEETQNLNITFVNDLEE